MAFVLALALSSPSFAEKALKKEKACVAGNLDACADLGDMYIQGKIGDRWDFETNEAIAIPLLEETCDRNGTKACEVLGRFYIEFEKDMATGTSYLLKGCDGGRASSCAELGYIYSSSKFAMKDHAKAAVLRQRACKLDAGSFACIGLAHAYSFGQGVEEDQRKAADLLETACHNGQKVGCLEIALRYRKGNGVEVDFSKAASYYLPGCEKEISVSCEGLGRLYETGGPNLQGNKKKAKKYYKKACKMHNSRACNKIKSLSK